MKTNLKNKAKQIRQNVIETAIKNKAGHIAPSLSAVDILVALYYSVMNYRSNEPQWPGRDRLIFSKAHGCYALYAILADIGVIPNQQWQDFCTEKSDLRGCAERNLDYGIEAGCGSLGHGLPIAAGLAYGAKLKGDTYRIYCIAGDGELQEGSCFEAIQFAVKHKLNNLTIIIDRNNLQAMDLLQDVLDNHPDDIINRLKGFALQPQEVNGHDSIAIAELIDRQNNNPSEKPNCVIAHTTKGYGLKCMENIAKFHFRLPVDDELNAGGIAYE